jgi:hypothetical protein
MTGCLSFEYFLPLPSMSLLKVQRGVSGVVLLSVFCGLSASCRERRARLKKRSVLYLSQLHPKGGEEHGID